MPKIHDQFYYFQQTEDKKFSQTAQGSIDLDRLMANKPDFWVSPTLAKTKKKKTLILANLTLANQNAFNESDALHQKISELHDDGFSIYLFDKKKNSLKPFPENQFMFMEFTEKKLLAESRESIINTASSSLSISHDEVFILDNYWSDYLLCDDEVLDDYHLDCGHFDNKNISLLKESPEPITKISIDCLSDEIMSGNVSISNEFPNAIIAKNYTSINLDNPAYAQNLIKQPFENPEKIVTITLNCAEITDNNTFCKFISNFSCLGTLELKNVSSKIDFNLLTNPFKQLLTINIKGRYVKWPILKSLLAWTPKLMSLTIDSKITDEPSKIDDNYPTIICLAITPINIALISKVIPSIPNLKILSIRGAPDKKTIDDYHKLITLHTEIGVIWVDLFKVIEKYISQQTNPILPKISPLINDKEILDADTHHNPDKMIIDADTHHNPDKQYNLTRIFYAKHEEHHPNIIYYRMSVFNGYRINANPCRINDAFELIKEGDLQLKKPVISSHNADEIDTYQGVQSLILTNDWQPLASLSPNEQLTQYQVTPNTEVEINYSERDNLYYIRANKAHDIKNIQIYFSIEVPKKNAAIPSKIQTLMKKYQAFGAGELSNLIPNPKGKDYLDAIQNQKIGSCRHRSLAFKVEMTKKFPKIPVRIINNECHTFVEIYVEKQWNRACLSGYSAKLAIKENKDAVMPLTNQPTRLYRPANTAAERYLETWLHHADSDSGLTIYQQLTQAHEENNRLLELSCAKYLQIIRRGLQTYCTNTHLPMYYISSPDELACLAPWIEGEIIDGTIQGKIKAGPGGRFYDFLTMKPETQRRILAINYANFSPADIVRSNTLLDKKRLIDGIPVPLAVTIVGLTHTNSPNYYKDSDFKSRFSQKLAAPSPKEFAASAPSPIQNIRQKTAADVDVAPIYLFHSIHWKTRLIGEWIMNGGALIFKEGELQKALATNKPIVIHQGLWDAIEFQEFWEQALLLGQVECGSGTIIIPKETQFIRDDAPVLQSHIIHQKSFVEPTDIILNPTRLKLFFEHYVCDNHSETLHRQPGFITQGNDTVNAYLTRTLTATEWANLDHECKQHQVTLTICPITGTKKHHDLSNMPKTCVIVSTDSDVTVNQIINNGDKWQVMDVSACRAPDLLTCIDAKFDEQLLTFQFPEAKKALLIALEENKNVLLKGRFAADLVDELAPIVLKRQDNNELNSLVIVTEDSSSFDFLDTYTHTVKASEKRDCLQHVFQEEEINVNLSNISLSQLRARLLYQRAHPRESSDNAWIGMKHLPAKPLMEPLSPDDDTQLLTQAFNQKRKDTIFKRLLDSPYVYLTGLTGVGKTTFVEKHIKTTPNLAFFHGESSIADWARCSLPDEFVILFIDEVNLSPLPCEQFEGLFDNPPHIIINGEYQQLTTNHKIIFAGNPLSYGDERRLSPFFEKHGNALLFNPMPVASVYEDILLPIFANSLLAANARAICEPFLTYYQFLCEHAEQDVLITPRELQMMAALVLSYTKQYPAENSIDVANYYGYQLSHHLVPEPHKKAFLSMPSAIKAQQLSLKGITPVIKSDDFLLTPSRIPLANQINDLLSLRELRQQEHANLNSAQLYGGLGGIVITGEPGIGKSELVIALLRQRHYKESHFKADDLNLNDDTAIFYRMPVSLSITEKQHLLLKAFDEGAVVIVDELNSSPMMERWFNDLLMGKNPLTHEPPKKPGFCLIGTQNPTTMAGRRVSSQAFLRRTIQAELPLYPREEMIDILINKSLSKKKATRLVDTFETNRQHAIANHLTPLPVFRDLQKAADIEYRLSFAYALKQLDETIQKETNHKIKQKALTIKTIITQLKHAGEKKLAPYLTITNQLLASPPDDYASVAAEFQREANKARGHSSALWKKLAVAMLVLGVAVALTTCILVPLTTISIIPTVALAAGSAGLLVASTGLFKYSQPKGLSKSMAELAAEIPAKIPTI